MEETYKVVADKALAYVMEHTNDQGEVLGVSGGTPVMPSVEAYDRIAVMVALYGQALAILAAVEADVSE